MQNLADPQWRIGGDIACAFPSEFTDTDEPFRLQDANNLPQMFVTYAKKWSALAWRQFVQSSIASACLDKRERAIIHHQVFFEELFGRAKAFREQSPQTLTADLAPRAIESHHRPCGMLVRGTLNRGLNAKPIAHRRNFPERDTGLRHTKRTGIHSEEQHAFAAIAIASQIDLVRIPGVNERIVNVRYRSRELQCFNCIAQAPRRAD